MNTTQLTKEQLADLKREFAHLMIGDMTPKELFEFAIHRVTCDVALMKSKMRLMVMMSICMVFSYL